MFICKRIGRVCSCYQTRCLLELNTEGLIEVIQTGNQQARKDAFDLLFLKHARSVCNYLSLILYNQDDVLDVCGEVFLRLYNELPSLKIEKKFDSFLFIMCRRMAIDYKRRKKYVLGPEELPESKTPVVPGNQEDRIVIGLDVQRAIASLTSEQREIVTLHHFNGLTLIEVSEVLDLSLDAVKGQYKSAKNRLRRKLNNWLPES